MPVSGVGAFENPYNNVPGVNTSGNFNKPASPYGNDQYNPQQVGNAGGPNQGLDMKRFVMNAGQGAANAGGTGAVSAAPTENASVFNLDGSESMPARYPGERYNQVVASPEVLAQMMADTSNSAFANPSVVNNLTGNTANPVQGALNTGNNQTGVTPDKVWINPKFGTTNPGTGVNQPGGITNNTGINQGMDGIIAGNQNNGWVNPSATSNESGMNLPCDCFNCNDQLEIGDGYKTMDPRGIPDPSEIGSPQTQYAYLVAHIKNDQMNAQTILSNSMAERMKTFMQAWQTRQDSLTKTFEIINSSMLKKFEIGDKVCTAWIKAIQS
jgi:hypothetical protein